MHWHYQRYLSHQKNLKDSSAKSWAEAMRGDMSLSLTNQRSIANCASEGGLVSIMTRHGMLTSISRFRYGGCWIAASWEPLVLGAKEYPRPKSEHDDAIMFGWSDQTSIWPLMHAWSGSSYNVTSHWQDLSESRFSTHYSASTSRASLNFLPVTLRLASRAAWALNMLLKIVWF